MKSNRKHLIDSSAPSDNSDCRMTFVRYTRRMIIAAACLLIVVGYILMSGPGNTEQAFNLDIFSTTRIVVAPMLCLAGYLLIVVGILWKD